MRATSVTLTISSKTPFSNSGAGTSSAGTLELLGVFDTTAGIARWDRAGGTVLLGGALTNTANTLRLNSSPGVWMSNGVVFVGWMMSSTEAASPT